MPLSTNQPSNSPNRLIPQLDLNEDFILKMNTVSDCVFETGLSDTSLITAIDSMSIEDKKQGAIHYSDKEFIIFTLGNSIAESLGRKVSLDIQIDYETSSDIIEMSYEERPIVCHRAVMSCNFDSQKLDDLTIYCRINRIIGMIDILSAMIAHRGADLAEVLVWESLVELADNPEV